MGRRNRPHFVRRQAMLLLTESFEDLDLADHPDSTDHVERRRGLRIRQTRSVKVYDASAARYFGGQTEDISATGLRIELPSYAPVEPGDTLSIHVGLSERGQPLANRRQMLPARVVWVNREDRRIHRRV